MAASNYEVNEGGERLFHEALWGVVPLAIVVIGFCYGVIMLFRR